jgi:hypothetical protein
MLKVAWLATTLLAATPMAQAENAAAQPVAAATGLPDCPPGLALALECALRAADANGDGAISAAELAGFALPAGFAADAAAPAATGTGLAFKDAATEPVSVLPASLDSRAPKPLLPALFALGALVVLLRKRPT